MNHALCGWVGGSARRRIDRQIEPNLKPAERMSNKGHSKTASFHTGITWYCGVDL